MNPVANNKTARQNISNLQRLREKNGITRRKLAIMIRVTETLIAGYEAGNYYPSLTIYNKLADVFSWEKLASQIEEPFEPVEPLKLPEPIEFTFTEGKCYQIRKTNSNEKTYEIGSSTERGCTFRYEGKQGIHHMFREIYGNWTRTYTDAQLIGKTVKEVNDDST